MTTEMESGQSIPLLEMYEWTEVSGPGVWDEWVAEWQSEHLEPIDIPVTAMWIGPDAIMVEIEASLGSKCILVVDKETRYGYRFYAVGAEEDRNGQEKVKQKVDQGCHEK